MTTNLEISRARDALEAGRSFEHSAIPADVARSWTRCQQIGLDPCAQPSDAVLTGEELVLLRQAKERLMAFVRPELELLSCQIAGTNFMCAFADENGVVLDTIMDSEFNASACSRSVREGSVWREEVRGTNALGLALVDGRTRAVTGREHFFACLGDVSCVSTPIFSSDGSIVGLLDASSEVAERQYHTQALVQLAAINVENRLFAEAHQDDFIMLLHPRAEYLETQSVGLIAVDQNGDITGANSGCARLLSGSGLALAKKFSDLFQDDFQAVMRKLLVGETVHLLERLNSHLFARLHAASRSDGGRDKKHIVSLSTWRGTVPSADDGAVLIMDDDLAQSCLRVACNAAKVGQPVLLRGAAGTGKSSLALQVHRQIQASSPLITVDCRRLRSEADHNTGIDTQWHDLALPDHILGKGGTLLLENIFALAVPTPKQLELLIERLQQPVLEGIWKIVATGLQRQGDARERIVERAGLKMLGVDLPPLATRTDVEKIARSMLAESSLKHRWSVKALSTLLEMDRPCNLRDLRHHIQVLAASCPPGVLRDTHVREIFPTRHGSEHACPRCEDRPIRRTKCLEIRRTFRGCQGNVAMTARRLGVSRNTVYLHIRD